MTQPLPLLLIISSMVERFVFGFFSCLLLPQEAHPSQSL